MYWLNKHNIPTGLLPAINRVQSRNSALDIGCGGGRLAAELIASFMVVYGMDRDENLVRKAAVKHPNIEFICGDFSSISAWITLGCFDLIVSNCAIRKDYCPNLRLLSQHCLQHGGTIAFRIQGVDDLATVLPETLRRNVFFSKDELLEAFPGFSITEEKFHQSFSTEEYFHTFLDRINIPFRGRVKDLRPLRCYYILTGKWPCGGIGIHNGLKNRCL